MGFSLFSDKPMSFPILDDSTTQLPESPPLRAVIGAEGPKGDQGDQGDPGVKGPTGPDSQPVTCDPFSYWRNGQYEK